MTKPSKTDPKGPKPTVAQARAAWEAHANPSLNNVLAALHAAGFTGAVRSTLYRWSDNGWVDKKVGQRPVPTTTPGDVAATKEAAQKIGDVEKAAEASAIKRLLAEIKDLRLLAGGALAETVQQETMIALVMIARRIQHYADALVLSHPKEAAKLIEALKCPTSAVTVIMPPVVEKPAEPKTVNGTLIEHDAGERPLTQLQQSIREFRSQQLKVVK